VHERFDDQRVELRARARTQLDDRQLFADRGAIRAIARHRVEGIAGEDDPGLERDRLAGQRVRIALAVEALVTGAHDAGDGDERRRAGEDALADDRVSTHERPLLCVEWTGLEEDRVGDRGLADVVQIRCQHDPLDLGLVETELQRRLSGDLGDAVEVDAEHLIALLEHPPQDLL